MTTDPGDVPCNGCTACCRNFHAVGLFPEHGDDVESYETIRVGGFTLLAFKPNGDCVYLGDNGCTIHDRLPNVCRTFDCRVMFAISTRYERRQQKRSGIESAAVFKAGQERLATLNADHPTVHNMKANAQSGGGFMLASIKGKRMK